MISKMKRGFTVVELMMALAVFGIGITGVVAMQTVSATSNRHAKDLAVAVALARSWQDRLTIDASLWGGEKLWQRDRTTWVDTLGTVPVGQWMLPTNDRDNLFGPAADSMGRFIDPASNGLYFCTHIRLTPILQRAGSNLVRVEVRVFWPKGKYKYTTASGNYCLAGAETIIGNSVNSLSNQSKFHFVYKTSALRETPVF